MKPKRWTQAAIECYERQYNCEGCFYNNFFKREFENNLRWGITPRTCQMKYAVAQLLLLYGTPPALNDYIENEQYTEK